MELARIESAAAEIIRATAPLVGGRTINIMDTAGVIIASSDTKRVGTFHQGAVEVLKSRAAVRIYPDDLPRYPGAREGVNLPILKGEKLLGVVGILGNPHEVEDAANLLGVYVGLFLEQADTARRNALRREMRLHLLAELVSPTDADGAAMRETARALSVELRLPARVLALSPRETDTLRRAKLLEQAENLLASRGLLDAARDIYGVRDGTLLLVKYLPTDALAADCTQNFHTVLQAGLGGSLTVTLGTPAHTRAAVAASCREALILAALTPSGCADASEPAGRSLCLLGSIDRSALERLIAPLYHAVQDGFGGDTSWIMETVDAYCACECSIGKAALRLHVHKNTLLYRIKKVLSLMGLDTEQGFTKVYFLKLLLLYHNQKAGGFI